MLGPLLFIIAMIDIDDATEGGLGSYADDTKAWDASSRHRQLQGDLGVVYQWADKNNKSLNGQKFQHLHIGKDKKIPQFLTNDNDPITPRKHVRDLGVHMSSDLTFNYHIYNVVKKGTNLSHWILRTFRTRPTFPMKILLKTLLVPVLEYACLVWCPNSVGLTSLLESVQAKFVSRFEEFLEPDLELDMDVCRVNYWTQLKTLKLFSLERRRERYMILFLYKIMIKEYPNPGFILPRLDVADRNGIVVEPKINLRAPAWVATVRGASFFVKGPKLWNIIPLELRQPEFVNNPTPKLVNNFKSALDRYLETVPDQPSVNGLARYRPALTNSILFQDQYKTPFAGSFLLD